MVGESMWSEAFVRDVGGKWIAGCRANRAVVIAAIFFLLEQIMFFLNFLERYSA